MNERITENLVRDALRALDYFSPDTDVAIEEQKSQIVELSRLLKTGGKAGAGGKGFPEFIISAPSRPDLVIVIECKASPKFHASRLLDRPVEFAVDGALHYARLLSKAYNVIAIGASGQTSTGLRISTFLIPKSGSDNKVLTNESGVPVDALIPYEDFVRLASYDPAVAKGRQNDLMAFSRELHDFMRDHAKLTESEKPLLVSGTLIALRNAAFVAGFGEYKPEDLQKQWMHVIKDEIDKAEIPNSKKNSMTQPYSSIAVHPELGKSTPKYPKGVLHELIRMLNERVWPFVSILQDFDVVGQFYGEFLKYTGGDKKALGIVLTPRHITDLFAALANVGKDTKVLDICAGTGGFLISAMQRMFRQAITEDEREFIRKHCLVGVEQQPSMYALGASNMILRGDGKANLYQGSCFDPAITHAIREHNCEVGMLNPPYAQGDEGLHELTFVGHMLDCLTDGGLGIAIVPISCATAPHPLRTELLKKHTLEAVMSMPEELFSPVGVITCIMVFKAHRPHLETDRKTWFGYWRKDGFVKTKHRGRIDAHDAWPPIRDRWIDQFRNREVKPGQSVAKRVTSEDEWCAEAYLETDYSTLSKSDFEKDLKKYVVFKILNEPTRVTNEEAE